MSHILSCSFGKDSIATALTALQYHEPLDQLIYCEVMFDETCSGEHPEHRQFIYEKAIPYFAERGLPTVILHSSKTYVSCFCQTVIHGKGKGKLKSFPLTGRCIIQRDCKIPPLTAYKKQLPTDTVQYLGIAWDESKRLKRLKENQISLLEKYKINERAALQLCQQAGLLSPIYDFAPRGGCWFCPNAKTKELRHLYDHHPDLWNRMLALQALPNKATERFNRVMTFSEIDEMFRWEDRQLSMNDFLL